jgi:hypothetical protein
MKSLIFVILSFTLSNFALAAAPVPEVLKMTGSCTFMTSRTKALDIQVYSTTATGELTGAHVVLSSVKSDGTILKTLARYEMDYVAPKGLSLIFKFQNLKEQTSLEVFGDDMGGMSTLTIKKKVYSVTCFLEEE